MYVFICMHLWAAIGVFKYVSTHVHVMYTCAHQRLVSSITFICSSNLSFKTVSFPEPSAHEFSTLPGQLDPGILLSWLLQHWDYRHAYECLNFYVDINSARNVCTENLLWTEPSLKSGKNP